MAVNWTNISGNWSEWVTSAYTGVLGDWFWPLVFIGIIGYIYAINKSVTSAAVAICLVFGIFGITGIFADTPEYVLLNAGIVLAAISGAFAAIFIRKKHG